MNMTSTLSIYNAHFGCPSGPSRLPDPGLSINGAIPPIRMLEYGMLTHAPITVITGEIGAARPRPAPPALGTRPRNSPSGPISNAQGNRASSALGPDGAPACRPTAARPMSSSFAQFQEFLIEEYASGRRTMLIFDEAQNLRPRRSRSCRMFSNINADKDELIQLVPVGQRTPDPDQPAAARPVRAAGRRGISPAGDVGPGGPGLHQPPAGGRRGDARDLHAGRLRMRASRRAACRGS